MTALLDRRIPNPQHVSFDEDDSPPVRPAYSSPPPDVLRTLLRHHGGGSLGWMRTWPAFRPWTSRDGQSAVSYCVVGRVAIALGDPVGPIAGRSVAVAEFRQFCHYAGWTPCWFAATADFAAATPDWRAVQIGEDTVIDLTNLQFVGKAWQDVRTALNRAKREGVTMVAGRLAGFPADLQEGVRQLSREWVADKALPEMAFTLGTLDHAADPEMRTHVAVDRAGVVQGVTTWLPVHRAGAVVGWTLDLMRRRSDGFRSVMEYLIAQSALQFQREGSVLLSLSTAPLAHRTPRLGRPKMLDRTLDLMSGLLEPAYGFQSLLAFKAKFRPEFAPVYLVYRRPIDALAISTAISRAYLPDMSARDVLPFLCGRRSGSARPVALAPHN